METITVRIPNFNWPLCIAYWLIAYSAFLVWRRSGSFFGLLSSLSFTFLAAIALAPAVLFSIQANANMVVPLLYQMLGWPYSLALITGALSLALALRSQPGPGI